MLALIVVVCITAIIGIGSDTAAVFSSCDTAIINAESGSGS
ncbi:MAG TPA: hypothetical protein VHR72_01675 [Gemmataceae bacterium]|nr:hypothetical protein [Gemmataceae bacterium]